MEKYALTNFVLLDGTEHMQPQKGLAILVENGRINAIVPEGAISGDFKKQDLDGQYLLPIYIITTTDSSGTREVLVDAQAF